MGSIYLIIILLLIVLSSFLFYQRHKQRRNFLELLEQKDTEVSATLEQTSEKHQQQLHDEKQNIIDHYENELKNKDVLYAEKINEKDKYIDTLKKFSINRGEVETHNILLEIRDELNDLGKINKDQMIVTGNLFVPFWEDNKLITKQIDHLVILPTDVYAIETKRWAGTVLHGVAHSKNDEVLSLLLEKMFPRKELKKEKTIVIYKDGKDEKNKLSNLRLVSYGNPAEQVMDTAIKLKEFLEKQNSKYNFVRPIVYYNCTSKNGSQVINRSNYENVQIFMEKDQLKSFFESELDVEKHKYSSADLISINNIIEKRNNVVRQRM